MVASQIASAHRDLAHTCGPAAWAPVAVSQARPAARVGASGRMECNFSNRRTSASPALFWLDDGADRGPDWIAGARSSCDWGDARGKS